MRSSSLYLWAKPISPERATELTGITIEAILQLSDGRRHEVDLSYGRRVRRLLVIPKSECLVPAISGSRSPRRPRKRTSPRGG